MNHTASNTIEASKIALSEMLTGVEDLLSAMGEEGAAKYRDAADRLSHDARRAREALQDVQDDAGRRARRRVRAADNLVRDHPWETAGAAAAMGAAIGALVALLVVRR